MAGIMRFQIIWPVLPGARKSNSSCVSAPADGRGGIAAMAQQQRQGAWLGHQPCVLRTLARKQINISMTPPLPAGRLRLRLISKFG